MSACPATAPASVPVTRGTPMRPVRGYHVSRFAQAQSHGLISAAELAAVTGTAGSLAPATVIYDTIQGGAMSGDRKVLGPFETAAEALAALRPADGSCWAPESRLSLLTGTLRAAGVDLGQWDQQVARWLAGPDVQTIAPVIGWVSRAGRGPAAGLRAPFELLLISPCLGYSLRESLMRLSPFVYRASLWLSLGPDNLAI